MHVLERQPRLSACSARKLVRSLLWLQDQAGSSAFKPMLSRCAACALLWRRGTHHAYVGLHLLIQLGRKVLKLAVAQPPHTAGPH